MFKTLKTLLPLLLISASSLALSADLAKGLSAAARQDWAQALSEFKPLAEIGDPNAEVNLGNLYLRGLGVEENPAEAFKWFKRAADQGNVKGEGKTAMMYFYGLGTPKDEAEAIRWFTKAAEQGDPDSASILGGIYSLGEGAAKDRTQAYLWYSVAADRGKKDALEQRSTLMDEMTPGESQEALSLLSNWREQHDPLPKESLEHTKNARPAAVSPKKTHKRAKKRLKRHRKHRRIH